MKKTFCVAVLAIALFWGTGRTIADEVMLNPSKDNTLYEDPEGDTSNGLGPNVFAGSTASFGERRAVMAFDIAGNIPAGSTITSANLTLVCNMASILSQPAAADLHALTADWGEGTSNTGPLSPGGAGTAATAGDATWLHTFFPDSLWATEGGDFSGTISGSTLVTFAGTYTWNSTTQMVEDVQNWLDNPDENYGWILIGGGPAGSAKRYASLQNPTAASRPLLVVQFDPPMGGNFGDCDNDGDVDLVDFGSFQLCFTGPGGGPIAPGCECADSDSDDDVDLVDFGEFQLVFTGPM